MARNGKIARLTKPIREELNRRLDNGEQGISLIQWLNGLPEVKQVLNAQFDGQPISGSNLTRWKRGGFLEWQFQQQTFSGAHDLTVGAEDLASLSTQLPKAIDTTVMARYAAALQADTGRMTDELRAAWQQLDRSLRNVIRLRRCEQANQRVEIQRELAQIQRERLGLENRWLELEQSKIANQKSKPPAAETSDLDSMTPQERSEYIKKIIYGDL